MRNGVFRAEEGALEVNVQHAIPGRLADIGYAAILGRHDACIVIEHIYTTESIDSGSDHVFDFVFVSNIRFDKYGLAASITNGADRLLALLCQHIGDHNAGPFTSKYFGGKLA